MSCTTIAPPRAHENRVRVNISVHPKDLARMDAFARQLGVNRSELLTYCFNWCRTALLPNSGDN